MCIFVLCLIVISLPPDKNPFVVQLNNKKLSTDNLFGTSENIRNLNQEDRPPVECSSSNSNPSFTELLMCTGYGLNSAVGSAQAGTGTFLSAAMWPIQPSIQRLPEFASRIAKQPVPGANHSTARTCRLCRVLPPLQPTPSWLAIKFHTA
jgi:hypothetical protein